MLKMKRRAFIMSSALMGMALITGCSGSGDKTAQDAANTDTVTVAETGPAYALITQPVGKTAPADYAAQLAAAKTAGEITNVVLMKSKPSVEGPLGFETLAVVEFKDAAAFDKWSKEAAPKLGKDLIVRRADLLVDDRAKTTDAKTAYVVSHYESLVPAAEYTTYTKTYISPNMDGQKKGGIMAGYAMYYEREPVAGIKGNRTVLVKQYVDESAFVDKAEPIKEKIKVELMKNPEWKKINDTKESIRKDVSGTLALPVEVK